MCSPWALKGVVAGLALLGGVVAHAHAGGAQSAARQWNEELLEAIRHDFARPTVHARNLFHTSVVMWDAWAAFDPLVDGYLTDEDATAIDVELARSEAISFASYRLLRFRFVFSPGAAITIPALDARMASMVVEFGFEHDATFTSTVGDSPAALGNRIGLAIILFGLADNSNEQSGYANWYYFPVNQPLLPVFPGNPAITDFNRWQPLSLEFNRDQAGNVVPVNVLPFLSPEWGQVKAFALKTDDLTIYNRSGFDYWVFHDPGPPPLLGGVESDYYKWGTEQVAIWSGQCDPSDGVMWDISPASIGNSLLPDPTDYESFYDRLNGGDWGTGYVVNPVTGQPYTPQIVPRGDYVRVLAEFWADGPDSETPPGHWFTILNYVSDHPLVVKRIGGDGPVLNDLEWDVKTYLIMATTMHDVAVTAWGIKGWYDYVRPVSAIRALADLGQSSDPTLPSYHQLGLRLIPDHIELVSSSTTAMGERHAHLAGEEGKIAIYAWRGPDYIQDPDVDVAGTGWILAENWWPYQRPSFVTPPFAGYVSGHSVFSRAAAEVMTRMTGSPWFPGGLGEFQCPKNEFLVFEEGPSVDVTLQWASYRDASDQTSLSRIWGGIHPPADDLPGRLIGEVIAADTYELATRYFQRITRIDIRPGGCPNPLNRASQGVLPLSLVGSTEFDVSQVDVATLRLARADGAGGEVVPLLGPPRPGIEIADVSTPFDGEQCDCQALGLDGILDLVMSFDSQQVIATLELDGVSPGGQTEFTLSGQMADGTSFRASDCVLIVPAGDANFDGSIDFADVTSVLGNWMIDYGAGTGLGDANADGVVDFGDLNSVLGNWLAVCP